MRFTKIYVLLLCFASSLTHAFTYQGELSQTGIPYNGTVDLNFMLFDASSNGNMVGVIDTHTGVVVTEGRFMVELNAWTFDGNDYWLEIATAIPAGNPTFTTLTPRQKISPTPYSEFAYDLDVTGLQLQITGSCAADAAISLINQDGSVVCNEFAAAGHVHPFSELTSVPADLADGDDDTTYSGVDFALSNQSCTVGQTVTGVAADGSIQCASMPNNATPPDCNQVNQALQYDSQAGWNCVDINTIGPSAGAAQGYELADSWGLVWDGEERNAQNWTAANQICESMGGRLPTVSELYRVSAAFKGEVGNGYTDQFLWSRTWWDKTNKGQVRLNDGAVFRAAADTYVGPYRCVWDTENLTVFTGKACMGEPEDGCWEHAGFQGGTMVMDKVERPAVSYLAASEECAFVHAHLAQQIDYAENIINGLPNGSNNWQWTSDHSRYDLAALVRWQGVDLNYSDTTGTYVASGNRNMGAYRFRCAGVNYAAGPYPQVVPNEFIASSTLIKASDAITSEAIYSESIDGCFNQGGHMAHSRDYMELVRSGMGNGPGTDYLWTADRSRYDITQITRWIGTDTSYTGYYSEYTSWALIDNTNTHQHRCVFYPVDNSYTHPSSAQCAAGIPCDTFDNGASKMAMDRFDRAAATYVEAIQDCLADGGRLPTQLQLTEAIRGGLGNGVLQYLWTTDTNSETSGNNTVLRWNGTELDFSPEYSGSATALSKGSTANYRCVWSNQLW